VIIPVIDSYRFLPGAELVVLDCCCFWIIYLFILKAPACHFLR